MEGVFKQHQVLKDKKSKHFYARSFVMMFNLDLILLAQRWKSDILNKSHCVVFAAITRYLKDEILSGRWTSWLHYTCTTESFCFRSLNMKPEASQ